MSADSTTESVIKAILVDDRLPSPSAVVLEVLRLTREVDTEVEDLGRLISTDPAICSRIIRVVNAPTAGVRRHVASIEQAVTILGFRAVSSVALAFSVLERNRSGLPEFDYDSFWSESLARAIVARALARETSGLQPDEAFTYGLLSGIGRLALVSVYPGRYREVLLTISSFRADELVEAERAVFEVDAEELSARMMETWGMPLLYQGMQHDAGEGAPRSSEERLARTIRVATMLARVLIRPHVERNQLSELMRALVDIGIDADFFSAMFSDMVDAYREAGVNLEIPTRDVPSLAEIYARAVG